MEDAKKTAVAAPKAPETTLVETIVIDTDSVAPAKPFKGYIEAIGRRKTAIARVRVTEAKGKATFVVNGKDSATYFPTPELQNVIHEALAKVKTAGKFNVEALLTGGGSHSQAEALRHGIARALVAIQGDWRRSLKSSGYLKRDPRAKERRKFGLKKARKSAQWSKR